MLARNARCRLASARGRRGTLRRVAREQRRLGDLARPLLGHAAAGLGVRRAMTAHVEVIGSYAELARAGRARRCRPTSIRTSRSSTSTPGALPSAAGTMRRAPEVIDAWFDSGSMPFAQWHYPFENREGSPAVSRPTSSPRASTRRGAGSTRCSRSRPAVFDGPAYRPRDRRTTWCSTRRDRRCRRAVGNVVDPWDVIGRVRRRRRAALPARVEPGLAARSGSTRR